MLGGDGAVVGGRGQARRRVSLLWFFCVLRVLDVWLCVSAYVCVSIFVSMSVSIYLYCNLEHA